MADAHVAGLGSLQLTLCRGARSQLGTRDNQLRFQHLVRGPLGQLAGMFGGWKNEAEFRRGQGLRGSELTHSRAQVRPCLSCDLGQATQPLLISSMKQEEGGVIGDEAVFGKHLSHKILGTSFLAHAGLSAHH